MPRLHREDFTSESDSEDSNVDPFVQQSDTESYMTYPDSQSDIAEPSPSFYWNERAKATANASTDSGFALSLYDGA
jgi:hypothetical protein